MAHKLRFVPMIFLGLMVLLVSCYQGLDVVRHRLAVERLGNAPLPQGPELQSLLLDLDQLEGRNATLSVLGAFLLINALLAYFYPSTGKGDVLHGRRKEIFVGSLFLALLIPLGNLAAHGWILLAGPRGITPTMVATIEDLLRQGQTACGAGVLFAFLFIEVFKRLPRQAEGT